jgi:SOS-response transcriptional repressors (RecA-mediated autopeptidases)
MTGLTPKQRQVYRYIVLETERGRSPSYREIAAAVGLKSKGGIARLVRGLEKRGHIRRLPDRARALEPLVPLRTRVFKFNDETKELEAVT